MQVSNDAIEGPVQIAGAELDTVAKVDAPNKFARLATADHVIWKKRLVDMFSGRPRLRAEELADHHDCRFGKWYHGPDSAVCRNSPFFRAISVPHHKVHEAGIAAVRAFNSGDRKRALTCIQDVEAASGELLPLLRSLIDENERAEQVAV